MQLSLPLKDINLKKVSIICRIVNPISTGENWQASQQEFAMQVEGVGEFFASRGSDVEYAPLPGVDKEWITIYLNGQILAALMHQRKILNFHASSFVYKDKGVLLLGETGAGKSSLTAAFLLSGAGFLSDDFTPVVFKGTKPLIWPVYKKIKLRENTVRQLGISTESISGRENVSGKYFLKVDHYPEGHCPLDVILKVEIGEVTEPQLFFPTSTESFVLLRSEVCSWEILSGMPETESAYLQQLLDIVHQVPVVRVVRPAEYDVKDLYRVVSGYLKKGDPGIL